MRPVDKGKKPEQGYTSYVEAKPYLIERIGEYCSYCEFPIVHMPEVEHKEAKGKGGAWTDWENLLLSCKYCNCRKADKVAKGEKNSFVWPDEDDTFHVFSYKNGVPRINYEYMKNEKSSKIKKVEKLFKLVDLDHVPQTPKDKDRRAFKRKEAFDIASDKLKSWVDKMKNSDCKDEYKRTLVQLATSMGFFSVWMEVFSGELEIRKALVEGFVGTNLKYFQNT